MNYLLSDILHPINLYRKRFNNGIIVSFPKSGRTWLRVILHNLAVHMEATHNSSSHTKKRSFRELSPCVPDHAERKVIFLHRNPMDTAVSGYFQASKRENAFDGDISSFIRDERHGVEKIVFFNKTWFQQQHCKDFLVLSYEAMKADDLCSVQTLLDFLNINVNPQRLETAVAEARFENMKKGESDGSLARHFGGALRPEDPDDPDSYKVRKGEVGGYRDYLSEADIAYCLEVMEKYDYPRIRDEAEARFGAVAGR